jgi:hypothetical protein
VRKIVVAVLPAVAIASAFLSLVPTAQAGTSYAFETLNNVGDPAFNQLLGINNAGVIAGYFGDGAIQPNQGYTLVPPSSYTSENYPSSVQTQVVGINNGGPPATTVGFYIDANGNNFGFTDVNGTFTSVMDPSTPAGISVNQLLGVNDANFAAGFYTDADGNNQGYLYSIMNQTFQAVTLPGSFNAMMTVATGINDDAVVSGFFMDTDENTHGFIDNDGAFTQLDAPNGTDTMVLGLNNEGQYVGSYVDMNGETQGFVYNLGSNTWQTISDPNSSPNPSFGVTGTTVNGINDAGDLVGFYSDGIDGVNGMLATPTPEPAGFGLTLLGIGLVLGVHRRITRRRA